MALYYYINISLSRINLKKISLGERKKCIYTRTYYIAIYIEKTQPTPKQNVIYIYRKIQLTSGQKEKKKRDILYSYIYIEEIQTNS